MVVDMRASRELFRDYEDSYNSHESEHEAVTIIRLTSVFAPCLFRQTEVAEGGLGKIAAKTSQC